MISAISFPPLQFAELQTAVAPAVQSGTVALEGVPSFPQIYLPADFLRPVSTFTGGGSDSISGSLEDLVSNFDEKLTMCFQDYQEQVLRFPHYPTCSSSCHQVDKIAPVQIRSQEEIMNECQVLKMNEILSFTQLFLPRCGGH